MKRRVGGDFDTLKKTQYIAGNYTNTNGLPSNLKRLITNVVDIERNKL